jgi:hypothetical protein
MANTSTEDWTKREYVPFYIRIKVKGNESLIAEFKQLIAERELTNHLIKSHRKNKPTGEQGFLDL